MLHWTAQYKADDASKMTAIRVYNQMQQAFLVATHLLKTTTTDGSREKFVDVDLCKANDVSEATAMRICNWM